MQSGKYIMARCRRCGEGFSCRASYASRTMYCGVCAAQLKRERSAERYLGVCAERAARQAAGLASTPIPPPPRVHVENRGYIPGGNIHAARPITASPLKRIYYP